MMDGSPEYVDGEDAEMEMDEISVPDEWPRNWSKEFIHHHIPLGDRIMMAQKLPTPPRVMFMPYLHYLPSFLPYITFLICLISFLSLICLICLIRLTHLTLFAYMPNYLPIYLPSLHLRQPNWSCINHKFGASLGMRTTRNSRRNIWNAMINLSTSGITGQNTMSKIVYIQQELLNWHLGFVI